MMVLSTTLGLAMDWEEPSIRNSNLLPVKASGEVRLRSVVSWGISGMASTPICSFFLVMSTYFVPCTMESRMAVSSSPRKMERMAGGASLPPRRWSLPG